MRLTTTAEGVEAVRTTPARTIRRAAEPTPAPKATGGGHVAGFSPRPTSPL